MFRRRLFYVSYYVDYVAMWFKKSLNGEMVKCLEGDCSMWLSMWTMWLCGSKKV